MSLVGTRPILQDELQKYELHHRARIAIKPGITGMWQVSGRSDITDFEEVVRLDTEYISNWNFGLDIKILFKTVMTVLKGGAETYTFDVGKMLEEHGHEVQYFGLENEKNTVGNRIGSYVTNMDFSQGIKANLNAPFRIIYSREARKKICAVLDDFQPDVVHLNNIQYHLTPSIILEINKWRKETKKECKIVYTTHDYQLVCPSHGMFDVNMKPCLLETK